MRHHHHYTQLCYFLTAELGRSMEVLNKRLEKIIGWRRANKLKFNPDKTEELADDKFHLQIWGSAFPGDGSSASEGVDL